MCRGMAVQVEVLEEQAPCMLQSIAGMSYWLQAHGDDRQGTATRYTLFDQTSLHIRTSLQKAEFCTQNPPNLQNAWRLLAILGR